MIEIPLTRGQTALIDDQFSVLAAVKWQATWDPKVGRFYATRTEWLGAGKRYHIGLHRAVMELKVGRKLKRNEHMNHVDNERTLDCRLSNLTDRPVTPSENQMWRGKTKRNTSGFKGVSWNKARRKWTACIQVNGKMKYLGLFGEAAAAAEAYDRVCLEIHGKFARPNGGQSI
jgi:hypothetical protein